MKIDEQELAAALRSARQAAERFRLPFRSRTWRGTAGEWIGAGVGSSIDFQDHRPYMPGDDPRYIDWQAYARSGHYAMKLYREEVSPSVDLFFDVSESMFFEPSKAARSWELMCFAVESARRAGAALRCHAVQDNLLAPVEIGAAIAPRVFESLKFRAGPWPLRRASLRVFISDLLFPSGAEARLDAMSSSAGLGVVLAPFCRSESEPDWSGNVEFIDCEAGTSRFQNVPDDLVNRYRQAYRRHYDLWREQGRKRGIVVVQVTAQGNLANALGAELGRGAVEMSR